MDGTFPEIGVVSNASRVAIAWFLAGETTPNRARCRPGLGTCSKEFKPGAGEKMIIALLLKELFRLSASFAGSTLCYDRVY
ncbi:MAG: hypothetical protein ACRERV_05475, partial [Methylococcales bacterium]